MESGPGRYVAALLGRPGSGKSSAADPLTRMGTVRLVRVSDLLKEEAERGTPEGRAVRRRMEKGEMVATDLVARVVEAAVTQAETPLVVLDGFPRQEDQVDPLYRIARASGRDVSLVVALALPRSLAEKRLTGRRICSGCGAVYNVHYDPPPPDACEECGGRLERRGDDRPEVVRARQDRFERQTRSVIRWFSSYRSEQLRCVRAGGSPEEVRRQFVATLHERHPSIIPEEPEGSDTNSAEGEKR